VYTTVVDPSQVGEQFEWRYYLRKWCRKINREVGGVNHCRLHCRLAKSRGLMSRGKYGAVIGWKGTHSLVIYTRHIQRNAFSGQSQRRIFPSSSNHGISPNDSVNDSGRPLPERCLPRTKSVENCSPPVDVFWVLFFCKTKGVPACALRRTQNWLPYKFGKKTFRLIIRAGSRGALRATLSLSEL